MTLSWWPKNPPLIQKVLAASAVGSASAIGLALVMVLIAISTPSDPQKPIGYFFAPVVATWFGIWISVMTLGVQFAVAAWKCRLWSFIGGALLACFGFLAASASIGYLILVS